MVPDRQISRSSRPPHARLQAELWAACENNSRLFRDGVIRLSMVRSAIRRTGTGRASSVGLHCDSMGLGRSDSDVSGRAVDRAETTAPNVARATVPMMRYANRRMHLAPQMSAKGSSLAKGGGICKETKGRLALLAAVILEQRFPGVGQVNPSHMQILAL